jgi:ribosomal protein L39E
MARYKTQVKKLRLGKQGKRTKWAPFWVIPKACGKGKRVHPSYLTRVKRSWRRTRIKTKLKTKAMRRPNIEFKPGKIRKKYNQRPKNQGHR